MFGTSERFVTSLEIVVVNSRNINASKITRYTVHDNVHVPLIAYEVHVHVCV